MEQQHNTTLSVILPVYNAAAVLVPIVEDALTTIPRLFPDYEIIIIDDHSSDKTPTIINNLAANYDPIMVMHHPYQRGYGAALRSGLTAARGDYILTLNADSRIRIGEVARLTPYLNDYDIITGYRIHPRDPWPQHTTNRLFASLVNRHFQLSMHDIGCHINLFRASIFQTIAPQSTSALIFVELYARAAQHNLAHIQVGIESVQPMKNTPTTTSYGQLPPTLLPELRRLARHIRAGQPEPAPHAGGAWAINLLLGAGVFAVGRELYRALRQRRK